MNNKFVRYAIIAVSVLAFGITALGKLKDGSATGIKDAVQQSVELFSEAQDNVTEEAQGSGSVGSAQVAQDAEPGSSSASLPQEETYPEQTHFENAVAESASTAEPTTAVLFSDYASKKLSENGSYSSKDDVSLYIYTYSKLPSNFITKKQAQSLGWSGGSLEPYAPGKSIGGDRFGNYEKKLPTKSGRSYTECDIDTTAKKSRGAKRIVFSSDGLIYYTDDHYESFTLLYDSDGKKY